jgi:hypothetical protein
VTQLGLLGPAQPIRAELDPAPKNIKIKNKKNKKYACIYLNLFY